jgi:hypothetical protein
MESSTAHAFIIIRTAIIESTVEDHATIGLGWVLAQNLDSHRMPWRNILVDGMQKPFWAISIPVLESLELP